MNPDGSPEYGILFAFWDYTDFITEVFAVKHHAVHNIVPVIQQAEP